jgi:Ca-activated chloride channel homolog
MSRPGTALRSHRLMLLATPLLSLALSLLCSSGPFVGSVLGLQPVLHGQTPSQTPSPSLLQSPSQSQAQPAQMGTPNADAANSGQVAQASRRDSSRPVFHTGIDVVTLNVTVTDPREKLISGLKSDDFAVYEDGVQQDLAFFDASDVPLDLALLLDVSASMEQKLAFVRKAATGFANALRPGDRAAVVTFNNRINLAQPFTSDLPAVTRAIAQSSASGGTALYNAIYVTLKEFVRDARRDDLIRRRAMVVLTDGEDTSSLLSFDELMEEAHRAGVTVYTIGLRDERIPATTASRDHRYFSQSDYCLKTLASETGAVSFFPDRLVELASAYDSIGHELAGQYALAYTSKNPVKNGAFRRLVVRIVNRPEWRPRTRTGYLADTLHVAAFSTAGTRQ